MADNNQPITGLSNYAWSAKFGNTTGSKFYDPGIDYSAGKFDRFNDWASKNPNDAANWYSKLNAGTEKFGDRSIASNPNNIGNGMFNSDNTYESAYKANYAMKGESVPKFEIPNTGSADYYSDYIDPISTSAVSSSALTGVGGDAAGVGPSWLTGNSSTSGGLSMSGLDAALGKTVGTSNLVGGLSLDDQVKQIWIDKMREPAPTFLGMDRANVGLSMQGLGLASQLYSEFGSDGNRKLRKEQIGALKDDRNRANEEQQAIRDYRNSYKSKSKE